LLTLLPTLVLVFGKANFTNMSRYSDKSERTYRHQYSKDFNFTGLNAEVIKAATVLASVLIAVMDCSFIPKSGKQTPWIDYFYNGNALLTYYQARFQIEFIFRDAKQFTGLCDAQTRELERLDYHFNASLTALNLAKYEDQLQQSNPQEPSEPFSMSSIKRRAFNTYLLEQFIAMLGLDATCIKSNPDFEELCSLSIIGP
jgi:hypothetical protein